MGNESQPLSGRYSCSRAGPGGSGYRQRCYSSDMWLLLCMVCWVTNGARAVGGPADNDVHQSHRMEPYPALAPGLNPDPVILNRTAALHVLSESSDENDDSSSCSSVYSYQHTLFKAFAYGLYSRASCGLAT